MLTSTFCHLPGVSARSERFLWDSGIRTWDELLRHAAPPLSAGRLRTAHEQLPLAQSNLAKGDPRWFIDRLSSKEHWRLFPEFRNGIAYLDIETTGLDRDHDAITTIALYDGRRIRTYVQGENLEAFAGDIREYSLLVTYNGKCFDLPFIENAMNIHLPQAHIDLRYVLHNLGYRGGLKGCERQLGLGRGDLDGVDGFFAVLLWRDYRRSGCRAALETLLAYNIEDVVNLEALMVMAYNLKLKETPFLDSHRLPPPKRPDIPFNVDLETVRRLRSRCF
ncbi:MAG: exonuclease [Desulfuromonadaceae bacterium GWC2_58_13]|nr:MAG: exonuclease [Desulfuromonadaceae bacterium GWC2_58_13]